MTSKMKKTLLLFAAFLTLAMFGFTSCSKGPSDEEIKGPSDEEIIGDLGQKFMLALITSNDELAKSICNQTGYETFQAIGGLMSFGTAGLNKNLDEAAILGDLEVLEVKMLSETKGVAKIISTAGDVPKIVSIPTEKNAAGEWKVAVTKQSFN